MRRLHLFLIAGCFTLLIALPNMQAKEKDPLSKLTPPPPITVGTKASMYTGRSIEIPLKAFWRNPTQVRFLVRNKPKHGELGEIRITSPNTAVVTYTHNGRDGAGIDTFSFAAQGLGTAVSAASKVNIIISEEPSTLIAPVEVDFGTVLIGESVTKEIPLENSGGGLIAGKMELPPAWKIAGAGSAQYQVVHGQTEMVRLTFTPKDDRPYVEKLRFSHEHTLSVNLVGRGQAPVTFEPDGTLELTGAPVRSGTIMVRNTTPKERTLAISAPDRIKAPDSVKIPPMEEMPVVLTTDAEFKSGMNGSLRFASGSYEHDIPVHLFAMVPVLKANPAAAISFGTVTAGTHGRASLKLSNEGGSDARLRVNAPKFLILTPDPATAVLSPGESREFEVSFDPQGAGPYSEKLSIGTGAGEPLVLAVTATINRPVIVGSKTSTDILAQGAALTDESPKNPAYNDIPPIKDVRALKATPYSVQLTWRRPAKTAVEYLIESRTLDVAQKGRPVSRWEPWPFVTYREENGIVVAEISNLLPHSVNFFRISSMDVMETASAPSPTMRISSPAVPNYHLRTLIGLLIGVALIAFFGWRHLLHRKTTLNEAAARIAKLG